MYTAQLADDLLFYHRRNFIRHNLKIANLLIGENQKRKIADFGFTAHAPSKYILANLNFKLL